MENGKNVSGMRVQVITCCDWCQSREFEVRDVFDLSQLRRVLSSDALVVCI